MRHKDSYGILRFSSSVVRERSCGFLVDFKLSGAILERMNLETWTYFTRYALRRAQGVRTLSRDASRFTDS